MKRILIFVLLLVILPANARTRVGAVTTNSARLAFQKFTNEDGLAQNTVFCLLQDKKGFLWIGTWHGLSRFDGYQFVNYTRDLQNSRSISDNQINSIYETKNGEIWVSTRNGLNRYNYATDDFDSYKFDSENPGSAGDNWTDPIFEDSRGTLWIGTNKFGLAEFDRFTGKFTFFKKDADDPESPDNSISGIGEDKNGRFWVATWSGLFEFDRASGRFTPYLSNQTRPKNPADNYRFHAMLIDSAGLIWLGTTDGLIKLDPSTDKVERYAPDDGNPRSLSNKKVRSIYETKAGVLWVGTADGLNRYVKETNDFTVYKHNPADPRSLGEGAVLSIIEDNLKQLWVGTSLGGLNKYNQKTVGFQIFRHDPDNPDSLSNDYIFSIVEDKNDDLWLTPVSPGLIRYDKAAQRFEDFKDVNEYITGLYADSDGRVWIGAESGLLYFNTYTDRLNKFETGGDNIRLQSVSAVMEDRDKNLWFGTWNGELAKWDRVSGDLSAVNYQSVSTKSSNYRVLAIYEDSLGYVWVGTRNMLSKIDPATGGFTEYRNEPENQNSLSDSNASAIYEDKNGMLWFGTESGGLNRFDRKTGIFTRFTEREGLSNNRVYEILDDGQDNLWLSTDLGLARFNTVTLKFRNFDVNDGLPHNEFNDRGALKSRDGTMYFGSMNGIVHFDPRDFTDSRFVPPVYLTGIRVLEKPLNTGQNPAELKKLNLSWRDYVVSFDFAALDFTDPKKLQYQWKLDGFDDDWIHGGTRRTATYSNLPGGDYILKVKATNVDGIWTQSSVNLRITVTPPFYKTFWFAALAALAAAALMWLAYRVRARQLHAISEARTRFTKKLINFQEAERKRIASELHDGLGQNLIIIKNRALLAINKGEDSERIAKELGNISESAAQALEEVREITNNLRPHLLDRLGLTKSLTSMCRMVSDVIKVNCDIDPIENLFTDTEEISIYRIVQELLNNVIKHSNASRAGVRIKKFADRIVISVEDNGIGFDTTKAMSSDDGLGLIGLKERTHLLSGEFEIKSKIREGTLVVIKIPFERK